MREHYITDWAFAVRDSISEVVEEDFPQELHTWPILKTFDFEAFIWKQRWLILTLRDKLSGIVAGPSIPKEHIDTNAPEEPSVGNIGEWQNYLRNIYSLRQQDACVIIPIHDCGKSSTEEDLKLWTDTEKQLWRLQIEMIVTSHFYFKRGINNSGGFYIPPGYESQRRTCTLFK
jgi:hypothetical protein